MKKVLVAGRTHVIMSVMQLSVGVLLTLDLSFRSEEVVAAGIFGLLWFSFIGDAEASTFIGRSTSWDASRLVPGYNRKIFTTSLCIACAFVALGTLLAFAIGYRTPPIGLALMVSVGLLYLSVHSKRSGNDGLLLGVVAVVFCVIIGIPFTVLFNTPDLHSLLITSLSSFVVQIATFVLAVIAAVVLKKEIDRIGCARLEVGVEASERIYPHLAGRIRFFGLPHPSENMLSVFLTAIPFFVIVGASHAAFADDGSLLLEDHDSIKSVVAAACIYLVSGTTFGSLKNPGMWLAKAWQFGIGKSRVSLGSEYAIRIVATCVAPCVFAFGVALIHATNIGAPVADWPGYANFYDEALLLLTLNLLCFTWACGSYPKRTSDCPEFLHIRLAMCAVTCLIFIVGADFGLIGRVLLLTALCFSAYLAVYVGGRQIAAIDFLPVKSK